MPRRDNTPRALLGGVLDRRHAQPSYARQRRRPLLQRTRNQRRVLEEWRSTPGHSDDEEPAGIAIEQSGTTIIFERAFATRAAILGAASLIAIWFAIGLRDAKLQTH